MVMMVFLYACENWITGRCLFSLNNLSHVGKSPITQRQHISCSWNNRKAAYLAMSIKPLVAAGRVGSSAPALALYIYTV